MTGLNLDYRLYQLANRLNELIDAQLEQVLRHPEFRLLHAAWSGIHYLSVINNTEGTAILRILDMSWAELIADTVMKSNHRSRVFQLVYSRELDSLGGSPFGLLAFDYPVRLPEQPLALKLMSWVAIMGQEALCPALFNLVEDWLEPGQEVLAYSNRRLERFYKSRIMTGFRQLRSRQESRFIAIVWPGLFIHHKHKGWEDPDGTYVNGSIGLLGCVLREFQVYGWFSGLQAWGDETDGGALPPETDNVSAVASVVISDGLEEAYSNMGIMPVSTTWLEGIPAFFTQAMLFNQDEELQCYTSLCCMLMSCRIGHYLKVMLRDFIGSTLSPVTCQRYLNNWLASYCGSASVKTEDYLSRYPLRKACVSIESIPDKPGHYGVIVTIVPSLPPGMATEDLIVTVSYKPENSDD